MTKRLRFRLGVAGAVLAGAAAALLGGAGTATASEATECSAGRQVCVTITDGDGMRLSAAGAPRYIRYAVTATNAGTPTLTNGTMTLTLTDQVDGASVDSAAVYQAAASTPLCSVGAKPNVLTCVVPNLPGGGSATYAPLYFQAPSASGTTATTLTVDVTVNEKGSDAQPTDPQTDSVSASNTTAYLTGADTLDADVSWIFPGADVTLATGADDQATSFRVPGSAGYLATLHESPPSPESFCPGCFGEIVATRVAAGVFSAENPIEVKSVLSLSLLPKGVTEKSLVVNHLLDDGTLKSITASCDRGALPCRTVTIDRKAGTVTIVARDSGNGHWGFD